MAVTSAPCDEIRSKAWLMHDLTAADNEAQERGACAGSAFFLSSRMRSEHCLWTTTWLFQGTVLDIISKERTMSSR